MRVAVPLTPTLVFTLVLAEILRDGFGIDEALFGGLVVYAALTTILPAMVLRAPRAAFEIEQEVLLSNMGPLPPPGLPIPGEEAPGAGESPRPPAPPP